MPRSVRPIARTAALLAVLALLLAACTRAPDRGPFVVAGSGPTLELFERSAEGATVVSSHTLPGTLDERHAIFGLAFHPTQPWLYVSSMKDSDWGEARIDVYTVSAQGVVSHVRTEAMVDFHDLICVAEDAPDVWVDSCATTEMAFSPDGTRLYVNEDDNDLVLTFAVDATTGALTFVDDGASASVSLQGLTAHPEGGYLYNGTNVLELTDGVPANGASGDGGNGPVVYASAAGDRLLTTLINEALVLADLSDPAAPVELDRLEYPGDRPDFFARSVAFDLESGRALVVGNDQVIAVDVGDDALTELAVTGLDVPVGVDFRVYRGAAWVPGTDLVVAAWFSGEFEGPNAGGFTLLEIAEDGSATVVDEVVGDGRARAVLALPY